MNRVITGIPGFDDIVGGGLPRNRTILVQGDPGSGKSTFSLQYLINGAQSFDENGLFLSLEYDPNFLIEDMKSFNWDIKQLQNDKKLNIITRKGGLENPSEMSVDDLINFIHDETNKINAKRLVIDSLNSLELIFTKSKDQRRELSRFTSLIGDLDCTTLMLSEMNPNQQLYTYLSHGVIQLYFSKVGANRFRGIEILKMRGVKHSSYTHSMQIQDGLGIEVLPTEIDFSL